MDATSGLDWPAVLDALVGVVGADHVLDDPAVRASHEVDWTRRFVGSTPAVVRPASTAEVAAVIDVCRRSGVPLVPQGGNTGLVGGGVPLHGEIVLDLRRLDAIGDVDVVDRQVTVGAGVTLAALRAAADRAGLAYAIDLGARDTATVGGMIATNAGGLNLIRYGGTREQVIGIEAVLGTGAVVSHLGGLVKDNTGYHLPSLLCGSEGTLGVVTAARLRLVDRHEHHTTALLACASVDAAVEAVARVRSRIDALESAELMLDAGLRLVCTAFDLRPPFAAAHPAYVLLEVADHRDRVEDLAGALEGLAGIADVAVATDPARRSALWRYREDHTLALGTLGMPHKLDITVPGRRLAEFASDVPAVVAAVAPAATTWLFGHVGDGNLHVNITGLAEDDDTADEAVLRHVASIGGSISAEHGIGTAKRRWLHLNRSAAEIDAMRAIKHALDPDGILNPHAVLP